MDTTTLATKVEGIEAGLEKLFHLFDELKPVAAFIPGAAPVLGIATGVEDVVEKLIDVSGGAQQADAAALSAGEVANSTGNPALDARLASIETFIEELQPFLASIAKEIGLSASVPVSSVTSVASAVAANANSATH